ncbi:LacI family DNA-binding transcriptional regulator [Jeotgalibacillus sp. S-D1]|uniref:substrate-binding domain-containing protein n=1 Tax=Jeotgalibacillus sp. S-D1 TaxID=2552189 RepID=UPI001059DAC2|nr:substrate-binding domain-containing protein [Jeotgalibacillus sp. S-D1]TDL30895.1 LacI family DNA-binding transcriptional regulator [Jeotgalibacillus sp. S-D1]
MKTRITITDVAAHAKVSKSTVSQYLNKRFDFMGEQTKDRIEQSIRVLGYQPNAVARSLKQKSTSSIGVIVANILHAFSTQVIRAIEDYCNEYNFHIIVCNADDDPIKEKKYIEMLLAKQVDGMIIFPTAGNVELYQQLVESNYPLVFLDRTVEEVKVPVIQLDNQKASALAVGHFIEKGYERIGIITTSLSLGVSPRIERINGFKKAMTEQNLPVKEEYIKSLEVEDIQQGLMEMMALDEPPEALIASNDFILMELLKYIKAHSIKVPDDLAIIGIDDVSFASVYNPALTTIAQPTFDMGKRAAEIIIEKIQTKEDIPVNVYRHNPVLKNRDSC